MHNLDQESALKKLVTIFTSKEVRLPAVGRDIEKLIKVQKAVKIIVMLGELGTGKSTFGNLFLDLESSDGFKVSSEIDSCTKETGEFPGHWVTNGTECTIIDTPGLNDSDDQDTEHIRGIVDFLRRKERVNSFLVVRHGELQRMNRSFKSMLATFELTFGAEFWQHVIIVVSDAVQRDNPVVQIKIEKWKTKIHDIFPKSQTAGLPTVILDPEKKDCVKFKKGAEALWKLISPMETFDCKDLKEVKTQLDQERERNRVQLVLINKLVKEIKRIENVSGVKSEVEVREPVIKKTVRFGTCF